MATRQTKVMNSNPNVGALGRVITQVKELLKTQIGILILYMEITIVGGTIFAALFLPTIFGIKTSNLKNEITQYDISISKMQSTLEDLDHKIQSIEVAFPKIKEFQEDGKVYKIIGSNGE